MGDANSAYTLRDVPLFKALDEFDLMMLEQPLAYDECSITLSCKNTQDTGVSGRISENTGRCCARAQARSLPG
jgi:hypothetical protein